MREYGGFVKSQHVVVASIGDIHVVSLISTHSEEKAKRDATTAFLKIHPTENANQIRTYIKFRTSSKVKGSLVRDAIERTLEENKSRLSDIKPA